MWLEIKALMTSIGVVFIMIGLFMGDPMMILFMIITGIGMIIFGDIIIGYQITSNELKPQMDRTPPGYELTILQELGGGGKIHFINTKKGPLGQRHFRFHGKEANPITDGRGMGTLPNGNRFFFSHESYDKNIDPPRCKAYEQLPGENLKETYKIEMVDNNEEKKE